MSVPPSDVQSRLEEAPCGYLVTDTDGSIRWANETFKAWTGYSPEDLTGRRFRDLLTKGSQIFYETHLGPLLGMQGQLREVAVEIRRTDGSVMPVLVNATVAPCASSGDKEVRVVVIDATERRLFEQELTNMQRRLQRLQDVATSLAGALGIDDVVAVTLSEAVDGIKSDVGILGLAHEDGFQILGNRATAGEDRRDWEVEGHEDVPFVAEVMARAVPRFVDHAAGGQKELPAGWAGGARCSRVAILPLIVNQRSIGFLCLGSLDLTVYTHGERAFMTALTDMCAQALERARLHDQIQTRAGQTRFLAELMVRLEEVITVRQRAQRLVDFIVPELADYATIEIPAMGPAPVGLRHRDPALEDTLRRLRTSAAAGAQQAHSLAAARETGEPQLLTAIDSSMYRAYGLDAQQLEWLETIAPRSYVGLPLVDRGRVVGSLMLAHSESGRRFRTEDLEFLTRLSQRAALALENARLYEHERDVARQLQASHFPRELPEHPGILLHGLYRPGAELVDIGGDWYDAFQISCERIGLVLGDVVGRGVPAAATMGQLRTALRAHALEGHGVASTIARLEAFATTIDGARAASVVYGELDTTTGVLHYACAGHPPPVLIAPGERPRVLMAGRSPLLGVGSDDRAAGQTDVPIGATVLFYSDGLVEDRTRSISDGIDVLSDNLEKNPDLATKLDVLADRMVASDEPDDTCALSVTRWAAEPDAGA